MAKKMLVAFAATMVMVAYGAGGAHATLTDHGSPAWWTDAGSHIAGTEDIYGEGRITINSNAGVVISCDWSPTGTAENGLTMGEGSITGLTFSACSSNAPGCFISWTANNLPWATTLSSDESEIFLGVEDFEFRMTFTGATCVLGNGTQVTLSIDHLDLTVPEAQESGVECPDVMWHPTGAGGSTGFTVDFAGSGTLIGPGTVTATLSGTMVICGDDVVDLGVTD